MKTLLVVDDELSNAEALAIILEEEGYRVYTAANGREGLVRVGELAPALVIMDFMMPIMNGAEMGRILRSAEETKHIRILMNSGASEASVREQFTGYDAFLRKPYTIDKLLKLVRDLVEEAN